MNYVHLSDESLLGDYRCEGKLDLLNIVMIGVADELPERDEKYELHRLLGVLLSKDLTEHERLAIIETEYHIPVENEIREDVNAMCNLSQGIREDGRAEGRAEGRKEGRAEGKAELIFNMHKKGIPLGKIAEIAEEGVEDVEAIIKGREQ